MAWSIIALASPSLDTSARTKVAWPPAFWTSSTVSRPAASPYSATTTRAPSAANSCAATRPMPPPAPVMMVTLSCSRIRLRSLSRRVTTESSAALSASRGLPTGREDLLDDRRGLVETPPLLRTQRLDQVTQRGDTTIPTGQEAGPSGFRGADVDRSTIRRVPGSFHEAIGDERGHE